MSSFLLSSRTLPRFSRFSIPSNFLEVPTISYEPKHAHTSRLFIAAARLHGSRSCLGNVETVAQKSGEEQVQSAAGLKAERALHREKIELLLEKGNIKNVVKAIKKHKMFKEYPLQEVFEKRKMADDEALAMIANQELQSHVNALPYFQRLAKTDLKAAIKHYSALQLDKHFPGAVDIKTIIARLIERGNVGSVLRYLGKDPQCEQPILRVLMEQNLPLARLYASTVADIETKQPGLLSGHLTLPPMQTLFVSTKIGLQKAKSMLADPSIKRVGIDTETKPNWNGGKTGPTALLQVATDSFAIVFDMQTLMGPDMAAVIGDLLENKNIAKLGVGLAIDVMELKKSYPQYDFVLNNEVDLSQLFCERYPGMTGPSLAKMCAYTYGKVLAKSLRTSNWGKRPLSEAQLHYAMLDAYCLLGIHDTLSVKETDTPAERKQPMAAVRKPATNVEHSFF